MLGCEIVMPLEHGAIGQAMQAATYPEGRGRCRWDQA